MKKYIAWKKSDIESLTTAYISGLRIKTIAHQMGRSPCSINRALDRLKIRQPKLSANNNSTPYPPRIQPKRQYHRDQPLKKETQELEVSLSTVITWAKEYYSSFVEEDMIQGLFKINGLPKSSGQLVLECNRWRLTQNLPLYYVHGVCL